ncbi:hypothetical protein [Tunturiibacter gelidoferens]|uniref:Uncharacterized protein n=1 Tax=Tunturiibacter gelidiferens TaxID=3069689 RepID=A0ACC5NTH6_9BACT|nr:hypothetical protein [Edaphobacter lichenicola]MBB5337829.1 hypothetical protein [Edaphobacter lichenicola]
MAERLSRKELYDLVWSEPLMTLCSRFGISDVALRKTCARSEIPTPERGYWAKKDAGKPTFQVALPMRPPGMDDQVLIAAGQSYWYQDWKKEELLGPLPALPEFSKPIEAVRERIAKVIGKVTVPREVRVWHPAIGRLLKEDETRREKQRASSYPMSSNVPPFDLPFERRRLRILNSLFVAVGRMNGKPSFYGQEARECHVSFYQQHVRITLDQSNQSSRHDNVTTFSGSNDGKLSLSIHEGPNTETALKTWQDSDGVKLETQMTEIAAEIVLTAEIRYRERANHQYQWRVERKAKLEDEERQRMLETERAEKERQKRIEQARIDRLLRDAAAFQRAGEIRRYVEAIRVAQSRNGTISSDEFGRWSQWALTQADRIDPITGGAFLTAMQDEDNPLSPKAP